MIKTSSSQTSLISGEVDMVQNRCQKWVRLKLCIPILLGVAVIVGLLSITSTSNHPDDKLVVEENVSTDENNDSSLEIPTNTEAYMRDKIRYKHTHRQLPSCLIIGIRKAGTRALLTFLGLHPQIQTASNEIHYFDDEENYERGIEWYRKRMPYSFTGQITIEKSPAYFSTVEVPQRVRKMNESMKLLLIVRDPVTRTISDYLQLYYNKKEKHKATQSFESLAYDYRMHKVRSSYPPIGRSLYYRYMWHWLRYFDRSQFLLIDGDEFSKDPLPQLKLAESFLGVEHRLNSDMFYFNTTRGFYCLRNKTEERCLAESKGRPHPYVDPEVISALRQYFAPYNQEFYKLIDKNFGWPEK